MTAGGEEDVENVTNQETSENVKEKKSKSFYSKIVIRRLPSSMKEDEFKQCIEPLPHHDYFRFVKADFSLEKDACTRAYINFTSQDDVFAFQQKFDGYVFVDNRGNEHVAVVEFAPNQKVGYKKEGRRKDAKLNTLDQDSEYNKFLESFNATDEMQTMPTIEQVLEEIEQKEKDVKSSAKQTTPLLQYMRDKKDEKIKKREEQREARRKRDEDRKKRYEEERQKRKELKEKEIRDRERRDKNKDDKGKVKRDINDLEKTEEYDNKNEDKKKDDETIKKKDKFDRKRREDLTPDEREQMIKEKREAQREKKREREEKEKERFRKREEERQRKRAEKLEKIKLEKEKQETEVEVVKKEEVSHEIKDESVEKDVHVQHDDKKETTPDTVEGSTTVKTKKYSDRRKEERLKKEKERQEKLKKKVGNAVEVVEKGNQNVIDEQHVKYNETKEKCNKDDDKVEIEIEVVDVEKDQFKDRSVKEDAELERHKQERRAAKLKRDKEREERIQRRKDLENKKNKERPDMQIYRPGMGKFSSRTIKKESTSSPKTSPEESRDSSPTRKSQSADSKDVKKDRRDKKVRDDGWSSRDNDRSTRRSYNTRQQVSKSFNINKSDEGSTSKEEKSNSPDKVVNDKTDSTDIVKDDDSSRKLCDNVASHTTENIEPAHNIKSDQESGKNDATKVDNMKEDLQVAMSELNIVDNDLKSVDS